MLKIKKSVVETESLSYADSTAPDVGQLDLGEGDNPYGFDQEILKRIDPTRASLWAQYPHNEHILQEAVTAWWKDTVALQPEQVVFAAGSIDAIYKTNALFDPNAGGVIGIQPQFSDYVTHAQLTGFQYRGIPLSAKDGYLLPLDAVRAAIDEQTALVYLDNPHNPTGQAVPLDKLREILDTAKEYGACVIADEAYGDYLKKEESAATLLPEYDNLLVFRSFSKGWGMAGIRVGYILAPDTLAGYLHRMGNPYATPGPFGDFLKEALADDRHLRKSVAKIAGTKARLMEHIGNRIVAAPTHPSVPICLLTATDPAVHLGEEFRKHGVRVIYGESFYGLDQTSVRLRVPNESEEERLWSVLKEMNA